MRRWMMLAACVVIPALQTGCGDGMVDTHRERQERTRRITDIESRQIVDDWDAFWLNDHALRTSYWSVE